MLLFSNIQVYEKIAKNDKNIQKQTTDQEVGGSNPP